MRRTAKPIKEIDRSTQQNPNYWLKKLMSKSDILQQGTYRNFETEELWRLNKEIISILIYFDYIHKIG